MEKLTDKDSLVTNYYTNKEKEFFLRGIGYHNLSHIPPLKATRIQKMYTLHFVLSGSGTLNIYGKSLKLHKYDMFFIPPDVNMSYYANENDPWQYVWVEFIGENSKIYGETLGFSEETPFIHCPHPHKAYKAIFEVFNRLDNGNDIGYYEALSLFYRIIDSSVPEKSSATEKITEQVKTYILCHFHNPNLSVEDICRDFNVSHSKLCQSFQSSGTGVKKLIIEARIEEAKNLLKQTSLSVGEVGFSVGFTDNSHFMKSFKRLTGITAGEYRKSFTE